MGDASTEELPEEVVDELQFLANSSNRIDTLLALQSEPRTLAELKEILDVSRVTVTRILQDLKGREWVKETSRGYRTTPLGDFVVEGLVMLSRRLETALRLDGVVQWFPEFDQGLGLDDLTNAEVTQPGESNPMKPLQELMAFCSETSSVRLLCRPMTLEYVLLTQQGVDGTYEIVTGPEMYDLDLPENRRLGTGSDVPAIYITDEAISYTLAVGGDRVGLLVNDDAGFPRALLLTDDGDVLAWAETTYRQHREQATSVDPERLD